MVVHKCEHKIDIYKVREVDLKNQLDIWEYPDLIQYIK